MIAFSGMKRSSWSCLISLIRSTNSGGYHDMLREVFTGSGQQPLAQVVLDRAGAHAAGLGQLAHPQEPVVAVDAHVMNEPCGPPTGPPTAPASSIAAISSSP